MVVLVVVALSVAPSIHTIDDLYTLAVLITWKCQDMIIR